MVPHNRLLSKLSGCGIQGSVLTWIANFLKHRTQRVMINGEKSEWSNVVSGVPQGTVLGPLLFLLYVNDLPGGVNSSVRLFADDCILYREIRSDDDSNTLQADLNKLYGWADKWQMKFNTDKCFIMRLTHARSRKINSYTLGGDTLSVVNHYPYLGITLSDNLKWNTHIQNICGKANRSLGFVRRNLHSCSQTTKLEAYRSLVRPLLEYASSVWDPYTKKNIDQLESVQKRAARFILGDYISRTPGCASQMVDSLGLSPLDIRRKTRRLCMLKQANLGHSSLPIGHLLQPVLRQSRHCHRSSYAIIPANKDCYKFSFVPRTIRDWNMLPYDTVAIEDIDSFKAAVGDHLSPALRRD